METEVQYHDAQGNPIPEPGDGVIEFAETEGDATLFSVSFPPVDAPE